MYKVEILSDQIEQEAITRRRRLDLERKERIFNPKVRIMGVSKIDKVDLKALQEQIGIKKELSELEKKREVTLGKFINTRFKNRFNRIDHQTKLNNEILQMMDEKVKMEKRSKLVEINQYRDQYQKINQRRDFDLYDPMALRKDLPARISDDDPRIGVSSIQRFEGEDLGVSNREALQKEQMRVWTEEQMYEKERVKQQAKAETEKYEKFQMSINAKMQALQDAVETAKKDQAKYDNEYNKALVL
jgi:hypothetical protein